MLHAITGASLPLVPQSKKKSFCANGSLQRALSYTIIHQHSNINMKLRHKEPLWCNDP